MITDRPQFFRVNRFTDLLDTPNTYTGQAGRLPRVNQGASLLEFQDPSVTGITSGWELIRTGTFAADTNITGLNGDADGLWMLVIRTRHTGGYWVAIGFNSDFAMNYNNQRHWNGMIGGAVLHSSGGTITTQNVVLTSGALGGGFFNSSFTTMIAALSGQRRMTHFLGCDENDNSNIVTTIGSGSWINTVDNITTINILLMGTAAITAGEFFLFRRR